MGLSSCNATSSLSNSLNFFMGRGKRGEEVGVHLPKQKEVGKSKVL